MEQKDLDNHDQFLRLYVDNEESLRGFIRSLVPSLEDAKEVMQGTAAVLWRKFEQLDSPDNFRRWAFGVARFEALSYRRDKARDRLVFSEELIMQLAKEAEVEADLIDLEAKALEKCITKLPQKQRALIQQAYSPGTKIDKIARRDGRTPMSLYKALHRIRIALADCIREDLKQQEGLV
jgi:RNA polymerase sigma-70 factor (ECF subfamily)